MVFKKNSLIPAIFLLPLLHIYIKGIDYVCYSEYILRPIGLIQNQGALANDLIASFFLKNTGLLQLIILCIYKYIIAIPAVFLIETYILQVLFLYVNYLLAAEYKIQKKYCLLFLAVLAITSGDMFGLAVNGVFNKSGILFSYLSAISATIGYLSFTKKNYLFGGLAYAASIQFHPMYGLTAIIFTITPTIYFLWSNKGLKNIFYIVFCIFISILPYLINSNIGGNEDSNFSLRDWHDYLVQTDPDDTQMLWTFKQYGGLVLIPAILYLYFPWGRHEADDSKRNFFCYAVIALVIFSIGVEYLHEMGVFIPLFSEKFISLQMRRGLWLPNIIILIFMISRFQSCDNCSKKEWVNYLLILILYVKFSIVLLLYFYLYFLKIRSIKCIAVLSILFISIINSNLYSNFLDNYFLQTYEFGCLALVILIILIRGGKLVDELPGSYLANGIIASLCVGMIIFSAKNEIFTNSLKPLTRQNLFEFITYQKSTEFNLIALGKNDENYYNLIAALSYIKNANKKNETIFVVPDLNMPYIDFSILSNSPNLLMEMYNFWYSGASIDLTKKISKIYHEVYGLNLNQIYLEKRMLPNYADRINYDYLKSNKDRFRLGFILSAERIPVGELIYQNKNYFLYKI